MTSRSICGKAVGIGAVVLTMLLSSVPARANMIVNGGFETGDFDAWLPVPPPVDKLFFVSGDPHTGQYAAWFGWTGVGDETLSQVVATAPGDTYVVDFWLAHGASNHANDFSVWWDGAQIMSIANATSFPYTAFSLSVVAHGASTTLMFAGREIIDYFFLDDVRVVPDSIVSVTPVPEPVTLLLVGTGVSGLMRSRRLRDRAAAVKA